MLLAGNGRIAQAGTDATQRLEEPRWRLAAKVCKEGVRMSRNQSETASSRSRSRSGAGYRTEASRKATVAGNGQ